MFYSLMVCDREITSLQEGLKLLVDRVEMVEGESIKLGGNNAMLRTCKFMW